MMNAPLCLEFYKQILGNTKFLYNISNATYLVKMFFWTYSDLSILFLVAL